jgi:uncharacterized membrane protein YidH (DUF202 family)
MTLPHATCPVRRSTQPLWHEKTAIVGIDEHNKQNREKKQRNERANERTMKFLAATMALMAAVVVPVPTNASIHSHRIHSREKPLQLWDEVVASSPYYNKWNC